MEPDQHGRLHLVTSPGRIYRRLDAAVPVPVALLRRLEDHVLLAAEALNYSRDCQLSHLGHLQKHAGKSLADALNLLAKMKKGTQ